MRTSQVLIVVVLAGIIAVSAISACRKSGGASGRTPTPLAFKVPEGFPATQYDFPANPLTHEGVALGRKLFHDSRLSAFGDVSCGSCHQQRAAFTTFDHDFGHGTNGQHTYRNVPVIFNMAWQDEFGWDGAHPSLDAQAIACFTAPERMAETVEGLIQKLSDTGYSTMFRNAFGTPVPSRELAGRALAQFVVTLVSDNAKYDRVRKGRAQYNDAEAAGYELFLAKCNSCHREPLFTDGSYRNNGLRRNPFHPDAGRMTVTGSAGDSMKFKVPTLRNLGITGYYTHDARFTAISEMISHYNDSLPAAGADALLSSPLGLTDTEKFYLQQFLYALTDSTLITDPKFAE